VSVAVEFEALGALAKGWSWQPLQNLTDNPRRDIVDGPFGSNLKASEYVDQGVPIARLQNVDRNEFIDKNIRCVTEHKAADLIRHRFEPGDILLTKLGDPLGKACIVPPAAGSGVIVADLVRIRPSAGRVDIKYLAYALNLPAVIRQLERHTKGTTRPRVNLGVVRELPIPVAPRDQQESVVAEIEKQFSRLDEAVANLKRVKANLKRYKAAVLKAAVEGLLFNNGLSKEPKRARWRYVQVGEVAQVISGLTKNPKRQQHPRKFPYLRVANVYANELRLDEIEYIGVADNEVEKLLLCAGDMLVVEGNGSPAQIGRVALWDGSIPNCVHQNHLIKVRFDPDVLPQWALLWLLSPGGRHEIAQVASSTSGLHTLSTGKIARLPMPLPPLVEQSRIVADVDCRLSILREGEAAVDANQKRAQALRQSVLARTFCSDSVREAQMSPRRPRDGVRDS
jgi:type I restriction enzyme, S subunit